MPERRKYDPEFREGAVTIVRETGKSIAEVARELGIGAGTLGSWVKKDRLARGEDADRARHRHHLRPVTPPRRTTSRNKDLTKRTQTTSSNGGRACPPPPAVSRRGGSRR